MFFPVIDEIVNLLSQLIDMTGSVRYVPNIGPLPHSLHLEIHIVSMPISTPVWELGRTGEMRLNRVFRLFDQRGPSEIFSMKVMAIVWIVVIGMTFAGSSTAAVKDDASIALKATIENLGEKISDAINRKDIAAVRQFYTQDATMLFPDVKIYKGHGSDGQDQVTGFFKEWFGAGNTAFQKLQTIEVERHGDFAFEIGSYSWWSSKPAGQPPTSSGTYLLIWKHQTNDTWKIYREVWTEKSGS